MKKLLLTSTIILTIALLLGVVFLPGIPLVSMGSDAVAYVFIRLAVILILATILFSTALGISLYRPVLLLGAGIFYALTAALVFSDTLYPADGVIFIETAIILSIEFLEAPKAAARSLATRRIGKFGVGNDFVKIG